MGSSAIVIINVFCEDVLQVALVEDDETVETLFTDRTDLAFSIGIGFRCANGSLDHLGAFGFEDGVKD